MRLVTRLSILYALGVVAACSPRLGSIKGRIAAKRARSDDSVRLPHLPRGAECARCGRQSGTFPPIPFAALASRGLASQHAR